MGCRYRNLLSTVSAFVDTGYYFLLKNKDGLSAIAHSADDIGIYYFIPLLASLLNVSIDQALCYFFNFLLLSAATISLYSWYLLGGFAVTSFSIISFLFLYREGLFRISDTYCINIWCTFVVVPLSLYLFMYRSFSSAVVWALCCGILCGYSHYIRVYSSLPVIVFLICFIGINHHFKKLQKLFLSGMLLIGFLLPLLHMNYLVSCTNNYLKRMGKSHNMPYTHSFWHNIYAGLGFLSDNYLEIQYDDGCSFKAAQKVKPEIVLHSYEYENILRSEVFKIIRKERLFFAMTFFAKLGVIIFFILACANIGLLAAYFYPKGLIEYIFWLAMGISSLPGLMTVPRASYLSGLAAFAFVYGIYSIIYALKKRKKIECKSTK